MSDQINSDDKANDAVVEEKIDESKTNDSPSIDDLKAEKEKWQALSRKMEKEKNDALAKLSQFELDSKQFNQLSVDNETLKKENFELKKYSIGAKAGLNESQIARLRGSTLEELEEDAKNYATELESYKGPQKPRPVSTQGVNSGEANTIASSAREKINKHFAKK